MFRLPPPLQVSSKELKLFRKALQSGQSSFLVKFNEKFRWAIIDLDSLQNVQLRFYFTMYATTQVPFSAVVLPGKEGEQRTLFVIHPVTREIVCARYIFFLHETYEADTPIAHFLFEVRVTGEQLTVPITGILPNFPTEGDKTAFDDFQFRKEVAKSNTIRFPLAWPRTDPVQYPFFSHINLFVLFLLLKKLNIAFAPTYDFQLVLIRFLACGGQEKFYQELPTLSDEDEVLFREFGMTYNQVFMGHPMTSQMQRYSNLTIQQVFLKQVEIAKKLRISFRPALTLPLSYFTDPEQGVVVMKGTHVLIPHSSLEKPQ
jgi:hypothetical protein